MSLKYKYSNLLINKANDFLKKLKKVKINGEIIDDSIREYSIKVDLPDEKNFEEAIIYYSPKKNRFTLIVKGNEEVKENLNNIFDDNSKKQEEIYKNKGIEIDVDGSYREEKTGYACIIRKNGKVIKKISGVIDKKIAEGTRQIAGELKAALEAIRWCDENNIKEAVIYYDYSGIKKWSTGEWKAKKNITQNYRDEMSKFKTKIIWKKIKSHTGAKWNEAADKLANPMNND
jgi:ribonuclease HI